MIQRREITLNTSTWNIKSLLENKSFQSIDVNQAENLSFILLKQKTKKKKNSLAIRDLSKNIINIRTVKIIKRVRSIEDQLRLHFIHVFL